jgi:hypothetical protein
LSRLIWMYMFAPKKESGNDMCADRRIIEKA